MSTETTTPQLTESDVEAIETRLKNAFANWHTPNFVRSIIKKDGPALIRDWRALSEKYARLAEVSGEWARLLDRVRLWSKCADGYPLDEHINNIATQNAALREQLAEAHTWIDRKNAAIETWQQQAKENAAQLTQVTSERDDLVEQLRAARSEILNSERYQAQVLDRRNSNHE